jgi:hypothetical protein
VRESQASDFVLHHTDPIFQWLFHGIKPFPLIRIFDFFQNKIVESKYKELFSETCVEKFPKYFWFFHWNPYLKTDSAMPTSLFSFQF